MKTAKEDDWPRQGRAKLTRRAAPGRSRGLPFLPEALRCIILYIRSDPVQLIQLRLHPPGWLLVLNFPNPFLKSSYSNEPSLASTVIVFPFRRAASGGPHWR
jgi:hypothetical protein